MYNIINTSLSLLSKHFMAKFAKQSPRGQPRLTLPSCQAVQCREPRDLRHRRDVVGHGEIASGL